jgi:hypothetical protein
VADALFAARGASRSIAASEHWFGAAELRGLSPE